MSKPNANDSEDSIFEYMLAAGFAAVWLIGSFVLNLQFDWFLWWHSFIFILLYAMISVICLPVIKGLIKFVHRDLAMEAGIHEILLIAWPIALFSYIFIAFFVAIGRLAR